MSRPHEWGQVEHIMSDETQTGLRTSVHSRTRVGLALSGGGARGLAHIGVLNVLAREGIAVDCLAGTSMGGIVAAAYASGMRPEEIAAETMAITRWRSLASLADPVLPHEGLMRGERLLAYFERLFKGRTFAELDLPLAVVAVDLNTGQEVVLREGSVAQAVRATMALPGIFVPVEAEGRRLADGGLLNNLPVGVARQMGAGVAIAVDVSPRLGLAWPVSVRWAPRGFTDTLNVLNESLAIMMSAINEENLRHTPPDVLIRPAIPHGVTAIAGYNRAEELIAAGECAAENALDEIRQRIVVTQAGGA